jgi:hypothetical protein
VSLLALNSQSITLMGSRSLRMCCCHCFHAQLSSTETHRTHPNTLHDLPKQAFVTTVPIQPSDIVIAATDGVLDNVFDQKIAQLAQELCVVRIRLEAFQYGSRSLIQIAAAIAQSFLKSLTRMIQSFLLIFFAGADARAAVIRPRAPPRWPRRS